MCSAAGGLLAVGWELGVLRGLQDGGIEMARFDLVIGSQVPPLGPIPWTAATLGWCSRPDVARVVVPPATW